MPVSGLRIGEAAKRTSLSVDTIRFYEKLGLLRPSRRTSGKFRIYSERDLKRLQLIRQTQNLGFSLHEVKQILELEGRDPCSCVSKMLREKIATVRAKIEALCELETKLKAELRVCEGELVKPTAQRQCPVLTINTSSPAR